MYQRYAAASLAHVESANKRMELWEDQFKEWWIGMMENDNWNERNTVAKTTEFRHHRLYSDVVLSKYALLSES